MSNKLFLPYLSMVLMSILTGALLYEKIYTTQSVPVLSQEYSVLPQETPLNGNITANIAQKSVDVPIQQALQTASSTQLWRSVQEHIKDTVVQVFVQVAKIDLLQPYKTPTQGMVNGSGFFINADGDLITNAHVVQERKGVYIQIPSLGKRIIDVEVIGISPERDLALLRVTPEGKAIIQKYLGEIPYLSLGDSDTIFRSEEVLALGYPLGMHSLKSTTGVISGRERHLIQTSAPINPGSSGGPLLNVYGEVIGINSSGVVEAQNVGYAIPINDLKIVLPDLYKIPVLRKPFLGVLFNNGTDSLVEYLGNPQPGGTYVVEVVRDSILEKAGVLQGDMIYEIDGYPVDLYGEMTVPWSEDKISLVDYISRLAIGDQVKLVVYRKGKRKEFEIEFSMSSTPKIHKIYPAYEPYDYEVFGGMVVMELTTNHIQLLGEQATGLGKHGELKNQSSSALIITHIFPNSQLFRARVISPGCTINEINGYKVTNLSEYRKAIKDGAKNKFFTIKVSDNVTRASDAIFVVLPFEKILIDEPQFARDYRYPLSDLAQELLRARKAEKELNG